MNKIIPENIFQIYKTATKYIDVILLSPKTIELLKTNDDFQKLVSNTIGIINFIGTKYNLDLQDISHYSEAYKKLCNKTLKFDDNNENYKNIVDMGDSVNYLNVFLKNTINMDITELENEFANVSYDTKANDNNSNEINHENISSSHNNLSDEELLNKSGYTIHDVADQLVNTQASIYLQRNIRSGSVFVYDSKPKIIPIIKYLSFFLFICVFVLSIASYVILLTQNGKLILQSTQNDGSIKESTIRFVNVVPLQQILLLIIIGIICWSIIRNIKNDNVKYFVSWGWLIFYTLFLLVITLASQESQVLLFRYSNTISELEKVNANQNYLPIFKEYINIWHIMQYVVYGIYGLLLLCAIIGAIFNPKRDSERINSLLKKYINEIRSGAIDTSGFSSGFGGFGSQLF